MSTNRNTNRLKQETSPYLLQHAYNPVDWYPWGKEALKKAKQEDKPILVSIGYSSCHWCHVMERECFEKEDIARLMNDNFVNIKVDREERPDVDQIYIEAVQNMGLQPGWPLNVFLTPDQKPFYGGTYFPAPNWTQLLKNVRQAFEEQREKVDESAESFAQSLNVSEIQRFGLHEDNPLGSFNERQSNLQGIFNTLKSKVDHEKGGLAKAPKFPMPSVWQFTMAYFRISNNDAAWKITESTLNNMALGGIYDQLGGGFARYSTDAEWFAPHFEKMLYDNGQLLSLYAQAQLVNPSRLYQDVIKGTVGFIEKEMTHPEGGFYSALDADSEGVEGKYYIWTYEEFEKILQSDADRVGRYYQISQSGNWENGYNILYPQQTPEEFARNEGIDPGQFRKQLEEAQKKLLETRDQRVRPGLDDKIITGWNGLMLTGLIDAYIATGESKILEMASTNGHFIRERLVNRNGNPGLWRTYSQNQPLHWSCLDDYAFVIEGFLKLYQVTFDFSWLEEAKALTGYVINNFYDPDEGFFYYTDKNAEQLIARKKEIIDNVIPSSNAAMAHNLWYLGSLLDNKEYQTMAEKMMAKVQKLVKAEPAFLNAWGNLLARMALPLAEVVVTGEKAAEESRKIQQAFMPNTLLAGAGGHQELPFSIPLLEGRSEGGDQTTIYVCQNKACQLPVHTADEAITQIKQLTLGN